MLTAFGNSLNLLARKLRYVIFVHSEKVLGKAPI